MKARLSTLQNGTYFLFDFSPIHLTNIKCIALSGIDKVSDN